MKYYSAIAIIAVIGLSACTQLSEQDRSLLMETRSLAQDAKNASITAAEEARRAREAAAKSAADAKAAGDRADRIFRQSQNK